MIHFQGRQEFRYENENRILCFPGDVINDDWVNINEWNDINWDSVDREDGELASVAQGLDVMPASSGRPVSNYGNRFVSGSFYFDSEEFAGYVFDMEHGWLRFNATGS